MTSVKKAMHLLLQADRFLAQYILIFSSAGAFPDGWSLSNMININCCVAPYGIIKEYTL